MGKLDTQTLLFASIFIYFLISFLVMLAALQVKRDPCLLWIATGFSILAIAIIIITLRFWSLWLLLAIWLSNILIILTHGCIWSALRRFSGKNVRWELLLLGPMIWVLLCFWPRFIEEQALRVLAYTLIVTSYCALALKEIWPTWRQNAQATVPLVVVLLLITIFYFYRLALWIIDYQFWPHHSVAEFWSYHPDAEVTLFIMMILFICLSFTTLMLVRGREENIHKLASMQDSLTQIPNRRALFDYALFHIEKAATQQKEITLLMCDLDYFKQINDHYGHDIGDHVLILFARVLEDTIGEQGFYARIGGEEFVVVVKGKSLQEINALALNIKRELTCRCDRELSINVSTSIGIATATQVGYSLHKLLICADTALYQAKTDNRNCVRVWSDTIRN